MAKEMESIIKNKDKHKNILRLLLQVVNNLL